MDDDFMTTVNMLTIASSLVAVLFSIIIALLAWIGNRTAEKLTKMDDALHRIENDLHGKISALDRRVTKVEARCDIHHGGVEI